MSDETTCPVRVQVGIDAAVVANHHVTIRTTSIDGQVQLSRFHVPPTIAGLRQLTQRLAVYRGVVAVAEPTSMTWLGLSVALRAAGADVSLVGARHSARLRGAISGKHKSDVIEPSRIWCVLDYVCVAGGPSESGLHM